jgi:hypothetical protein
MLGFRAWLVRTILGQRALFLRLASGWHAGLCKLNATTAKKELDMRQKKWNRLRMPNQTNITNGTAPKHADSTCTDCGADLPKHPPGYCGGSGYAITPENRRICYACADKRQVADLLDRSKPFCAYLSTSGLTITTWTGGKLMTVTRETDWRIFGSRHSVGSCVSAVDVHGKRWHGRGAGRGMAINLRPSKS